MAPGRLFWKFFLAFWLAQVVTALGVGALLWLHHPERPPDGPPPGWSRPAEGPPGGRPPPPPMQPRFPPLLPILSGSIVSLGFAWLLAWYFSRPIRTLRRAFDRVAAGQLDTRVGPEMGERRDELAGLGADFDRMAERLQDLVGSQRRLLHDVSHEVRSPLARMQAVADLMQQQPDRAAEWIDRMRRDTGRIDRLVGELLTLSRLDGGLQPLHVERFDMGTFLRNLAAEATVEAAAKHCTVETRIESSSPVDADPELLRRAVENVLRNAVRHTPDGTTVILHATRDADRWTLCVQDEGPGVPDQELAAIFEPFHRAPDARPAEGYGLGLAIARQVMKRHGGHIHAENRPGRGLRVFLNLPVAAAEPAGP